MKISEKRLRAAKAQRQAKIQQLFNAYGRGSTIRLHKKRYLVVNQQEINEDYYFLLQGASGYPFVAKLNYSEPMRVTRTSNRYKNNKDFFDNWIKQAKIRQKEEVKEFFENPIQKHSVVVVRNKADKDHESVLCKFVLKKRLNGKYYFVVRDEDNNYLIAKVVWYGFAKTVKLTEKEFDKNQAEFEAWIKEAKASKKKK